MRGRSWAREEDEKARISLAWYIEALARTKRLPDLDVLLDPAELRDQAPEDIFALLEAMHSAGAPMEIGEVEVAPWEVQ